jgi:Family of unknown function (DUF5522)
MQDFYIENGNYVFTEAYHRRRGNCCGSGCRHCPYEYEGVVLPNFELRKASFPMFNQKPITQFFLSKNVTNFEKSCIFIADLKYERPSENSITALLAEGRGTCSTKHVTLKKLAAEQGYATDIKLMIGIYKMTAENTKGIGDILIKNGLDYLPEAHTYLKYKNRVFDFTTPKSNKNTAFANDLLLEIEVDADKILLEKANLHRSFLKKWLTEQVHLQHFSVSDIWKIREQAIAQLVVNL